MESLEKMISQATTRRSDQPQTIKNRKAHSEKANNGGGRRAAAVLSAEEQRRKEEEQRRKEEEEREEEELERQCELWVGKLCKVIIFVPLLFANVVQPIGEYAMRPNMVVDTTVDLAGQFAIVTGGCAGIGLHSAQLLAEAGASVVLGCRDPNSMGAARALRAVKLASERWRKTNEEHKVETPIILQLRLDKFASVRTFAQQYSEKYGDLHILVNNAGTRVACNTTTDGIEYSFQANYLGHFLLVKLLLPMMQKSSPARVVNVVCRDGYIRASLGWSHWFRDGWFAGWLGLPTPITDGVRVGSTMIELKGSGKVSNDDDDIEFEGAEVVDDNDPDADDEDDSRPASSGSGSPSVHHSAVNWTLGCAPEKAYANAKLAVLSFSHELERRLRSSLDGEGVVSHAVNPNVVATDFFEKGTPPTPQRQSMYATVLSYFPPMWIARKVFGYLHGKMTATFTRSVEHGGKAVFHVATSQALSGAGGGLFDDTESAFTGCSRPAHLCGRVRSSWQPVAALNRQAASQLWSVSEDLIRAYVD
eukprot:gnl/TRDRNA2_/TRDRNA2_189003_c0_seq1.p1 gnl/TRDRNA2_/TRDRNA2_189003_c0~~gnl/TRDRNA2_/TRDRNA2_189003_c0_seq1.p1  ORF type:complete len:534 (+),score=106.75 gnl/TRDRNA2_/TRDRNA2_189003_c0_seq1:68-1669(+)